MMALNPRPLHLLRASVEMAAPCIQCHVRAGKFDCLLCKAVKYCSEECQELNAGSHKEECQTISDLVDQTRGAIKALEEKFGIDASGENQKAETSQGFCPSVHFLHSSIIKLGFSNKHV